MLLSLSFFLSVFHILSPFLFCIHLKIFFFLSLFPGKESGRGEETFTGDERRRHLHILCFVWSIQLDKHCQELGEYQTTQVETYNIRREEPKTILGLMLILSTTRYIREGQEQCTRPNLEKQGSSSLPT